MIQELTARDRIAIEAMKGLLNKGYWTTDVPKELGQKAYEIADQMLAARHELKPSNS